MGSDRGGKNPGLRLTGSTRAPPTSPHPEKRAGEPPTPRTAPTTGPRAADSQGEHYTEHKRALGEQRPPRTQPTPGTPRVHREHGGQPQTEATHGIGDDKTRVRPHQHAPTCRAAPPRPPALVKNYPRRGIPEGGFFRWPRSPGVDGEAGEYRKPSRQAPQKPPVLRRF